MTQVALAAASGVSRSMIQRIEAGRADGASLRALERTSAALGAGLHVALWWEGATLDRLADAGHAHLQNAFASLLRNAGWTVAAEVSFSHYGDRGRCDLLAFHPGSGALLIVEVKASLGDLQDLFGRLDVKARLAPQLSATQGWPRPRRVVRCLVLADTRTVHRIVAGHSALFAAFGTRGQAARRWLRRPSGVSESVLVFLPLPHARVRKRSAGAGAGPPAR
jgi:hypothetical protein